MFSLCSYVLLSFYFQISEQKVVFFSQLLEIAVQEITVVLLSLPSFSVMSDFWCGKKNTLMIYAVGKLLRYKCIIVFPYIFEEMLTIEIHNRNA